MAPLLRTQKNHINFSDEIFNAIKASTNSTRILPRDAEALVKDLRYILDVVGKDGATLNVQQWQEEVHWNQFHDFMSARAQVLPYPPHLFRAHLFGDLIPRFQDEMTGELCDSFGSDLHALAEEEGQSELFVTLSTPKESVNDISGLVEATTFHLKKTQINAYRMRNKQEAYLSQMVSLSGDLRWTMHTTCQKGQMANEDQAAGLAIFDTSKIKETGVQLWRVKDLLDFFDSNPRFRGSKIDSYARTWAKNADEYLCWDLVPKEALINFVPFENLAQQEDKPDDVLLQAVFLSSTNLAVYRGLIYPLRTITTDDYMNKISSFMVRFMDHVTFRIDADSFVNTMVRNFRDPLQWGYKVSSGEEDLEAELRRVINVEYAWGVSRWIDAYPRCAPRYLDLCERIYSERNEAAKAVNPSQLTRGHNKPQ